MRLLFAFLFALSFAAPAAAQGGLTTARNALEDLDAIGCLDDAGLTVDGLGLESLRLAVVVYPDGGWSLALGTHEELALTDAGRRDLVQHCLESRLDVLLPSNVASPPRATSVVSRSVTDPAPAEREVLGFVRSQREAIESCLFSGARAPRRRMAARLHVLVGADGIPRVTGRGHDAAAIAQCVQPAIDGVQLNGAEADVDVAFQPPPPPPAPPPPPPPSTEPRPDGREGAICGWGQRRPDWMSRPDPMPCRRGLTCCTAGGAAGSDAVCMNVGGGSCPAYP